MERRRKIGGGHDSWEHLDSADRVGLPQAGDELELCEVQFSDRRAAHLLETNPPSTPLGLDGYSLELDRPPGHADIQLEGGAERDLQRLYVLGIPESLHAQFIRAGRHVGDPERPEPVRVRGQSPRFALKECRGGPVDRGALQIAHSALYGRGLGLGGSGVHNKTQHAENGDYSTTCVNRKSQAFIGCRGGAATRPSFR